MADPEVGHVLHGRTSQLTPAQSPEVFSAAVHAPAQFRQVPGFARRCSNSIPELRQPILDMPRLGKPQDVSVDELRPLVQRRRLRLPLLLVIQPPHRGCHGLAVELRQHRGAGRAKRSLARRCIESHPGKGPALPRNRMKGVQRMRRRHARQPGRAPLPTPIQQDPSLPAKARQEVRPRQIRPNHRVRHRGIRKPHMRDVQRHQRRALRRTDNPLPSPRPHPMRLDQLRRFDGSAHPRTLPRVSPCVNRLRRAAASPLGKVSASPLGNPQKSEFVIRLASS